MSDHIRISPAAATVTVTAGGEKLGQSANALELREGGAVPVLYVPRADIDMSRLEKTTRSSRCPWKGEASYYSIRTLSGVLENAVWSYETPINGVDAIAGHLAFYPDKVTVTKG
ncbi:MAG: hypothetical protein B7Z10_05080 [Rhodobacterales bacterium 32-66-7]|nr:MAG: hypothetical protein B7Z10_05080 [Rhodobacterales bacterium 32-66-7]OZA08096.1 MAG: hypothetical protein B7Y02_12990 [Rhodobacterales bacterium 17-64-5]